MVQVYITCALNRITLYYIRYSVILLQKRKDWCKNEISIYCGTCV